MSRETEGPFFLRSYRFSAHIGRSDRVHCSECLLWLVVHQMTAQVFKSADETLTADLEHRGLRGINLSETSYCRAFDCGEIEMSCKLVSVQDAAQELLVGQYALAEEAPRQWSKAGCHSLLRQSVSLFRGNKFPVPENASVLQSPDSERQFVKFLQNFADFSEYSL